MRVSTERELGEIERRIGHLLDAIERGIVTASTKDRLLDLERGRDGLRAQVRARGTPPSIRLHPSMAEIYRRKIVDLERALNDPRDRAEARQALRGLIDSIVLMPGRRRGEILAELRGELAGLLQFSDTKPKAATPSDVLVSLVAGEGFEPPTKGL